jgi:hypothetical protein
MTSAVGWRRYGERWETYFNEIQRVLEVNLVDPVIVHDALHNASILLSGVFQRQAKEQAARQHDDAAAGSGER